MERKWQADPVTALPTARSSMVGRDEDLQDLLDLVADQRLVTVVGAGGIGKTRLAVAVVEIRARREQAVGFVELADVGDGALVVDAIADQIGVEVVAGGSRYEALVHALGARTTLLVVDNFEHVVEAAPDLTSLLDECPALHLLVTSRRALGVPDEVVVRLGPLAATAPDGAVAAPGVQLLLARSHAVDPTPAEVDAASRIVTGLGGLPLAVELAASRARALGLTTVHELLVDDLALSGFERQGDDGRHSGLRNCLDWTYRDLDPRAQAVFRATGSFAGTFDLAALRAVVGDQREAAAGLAALVEHHLVDRVEPERGAARYVSTPPIREYARELLAAAPEAEVVCERHARHYSTVATEIRSTFERADAPSAFATFQREEANLVAAIATWRESGRYTEAAQVACDLGKVATEFGRDHQVIGWFRELDRLTRRDGGALPREARAWAAFAEMTEPRPGASTDAMDRLRAVVDESRAAGDEIGEYRALDRLAMASAALGDVAGALDASRDAIEIATRRQLGWPLAQLLTWHAMLLHVIGDIPGARRSGYAGLRIARELGAIRLIVRVGLLFAPMERTEEMDRAGVPDLATCLELAHSEGSIVDELYVIMQLAVRAGFAGRPEVFGQCDRGLELVARTRSQGGELIFVLALAGAAFRRGDDDVAEVLDTALREEWGLLSFFIPAAGLRQYEEIVACRRAERGVAVAGPAVTTRRGALELARAYAARGEASPPADGGARLTARERDVLRELAAGGTNKEIAQALGLRPKTVMHHCASIYRKLGVRTRAEATAVALRSGLLDRS